MLSLFEEVNMGSYRIGNVELGGPFLLAPLAGITDQVMRSLCEEQGADLTFTEMVSAKGLYYGDKNTAKLIYISEEAGPTGIQIFGSEPDIIAYAAEKLNDQSNVILDINMGCPVPKIVNNGDGAALIKDTDLVYRVIRAAAQVTDKPVTVKIRKGFDEETVNAVEVALACESGGASAVCVHGRTREQYYSGEADWDIIRQVKKAVSIPVVGNGDVKKGSDAIRMMEYTGCDFVMAARGVLGNPWIFRDLKGSLAGEDPLEQPSLAEISEMMLRHFDGLCLLKGEYSAVREMRKHFSWYTRGIRGSSALRRLVNEIETAEEMRGVLRLE